MPLIEQALGSWIGTRVSVAWDTSKRWKTYGLMRFSVIDRGRAVPWVWQVIAHQSAAVSFATYQDVFAQATARFPCACEVVLLADRGFADTPLMGHWRDLGWHGRIRITSNFWMHPTPLRPLQVGNVALKAGHMSVWHGVARTDTPCGPVHLAGARPLGSAEYWYVSSDEAADLKPCAEYGLRFDSELLPNAGALA